MDGVLEESCRSVSLPLPSLILITLTNVLWDKATLTLLCGTLCAP